MLKVYKISIGLFLLLLLGCNENIDFNLDDAKRHVWMNTFVHSPLNFSGKHNLDESSIVFSFETELDLKEYYKRVDSLAASDGWKTPFSSRDYRVYVRNNFGELADSVPIIVKVHSLESGVMIVEIR